MWCFSRVIPRQILSSSWSVTSNVGSGTGMWRRQEQPCRTCGHTPLKGCLLGNNPELQSFAGACDVICADRCWASARKHACSLLESPHCRACGFSVGDACHRRYGCPGIKGWDKLSDHALAREPAIQERKLGEVGPSVLHDLHSLGLAPPPKLAPCAAVHACQSWVHRRCSLRSHVCGWFWV